jgi:rhodanese-related sulfurtransferase
MRYIRKLNSYFFAIFLLMGMSMAVRAEVPFVSLETARAALENISQIVIDIRETGEHATGVARGALLIPMSQLGKHLSQLPAKQPFLVICNTQNRSSRVVEQLHAAGYINASYVKGGMSLWASRGWPMVKP